MCIHDVMNRFVCLLLLDAVIYSKKNPACSPQGNYFSAVYFSSSTCILFIFYFFTEFAVISFPGAILQRSTEMLVIVSDWT